MQQLFFEQRLVSYIEQANLYYRRRLPVPALDFSLKGAAAGQMVARRVTRSKSIYTIRLNGALLKDNVEYFEKEVLPHEVAHMVVDKLYGRRVKPHGAEWQEVMEQCFKVPAKRCHTLETQPARQHRKDFLYQCGCQVHEFTARRHKSALQGSTYLCRACRQPLQFAGEKA